MENAGKGKKKKLNLLENTSAEQRRTCCIIYGEPALAQNSSPVTSGGGKWSGGGGLPFFFSVREMDFLINGPGEKKWQAKKKEERKRAFYLRNAGQRTVRVVLVLVVGGHQFVTVRTSPLLSSV